MRLGASAPTDTHERAEVPASLIERTRRSALVRVTALVLATRVVMALWDLALSRFGARLALSRLARLDAAHILRVAQVGYRASGPEAKFIVYLPLYPLTVRALAILARNLVFSATLVSLVASIGAGYFLHRLVELGGSRAEAWRSVVALLGFPTAFFLALPYTEALFLAALIASVYAARRRRWGVSGIAAALATGTRLPGLALLPALAVEAWRAGGSRRDVLRRLALLSPAPLGFLAYLAVNRAVHGSFVYFLHADAAAPWYQRPEAPWTSIAQAVGGLIHPLSMENFFFTNLGRLAAIAIGSGLLVWGRRRLPAADRVYGWVGLLLAVSGTRIISAPRYLLGLYPLPVVLGSRLRGRAFAAVVLAGLAIQAVLLGRYLTYHWAF